MKGGVLLKDDFEKRSYKQAYENFNNLYDRIKSLYSTDYFSPDNNNTGNREINDYVNSREYKFYSDIRENDLYAKTGLYDKMEIIEMFYITEQYDKAAKIILDAIDSLPGAKKIFGKASYKRLRNQPEEEVKKVLEDMDLMIDNTMTNEQIREINKLIREYPEKPILEGQKARDVKAKKIPELDRTITRKIDTEFIEGEGDIYTKKGLIDKYIEDEKAKGSFGKDPLKIEAEASQIRRRLNELSKPILISTMKKLGYPVSDIVDLSFEVPRTTRQAPIDGEKVYKSFMDVMGLDKKKYAKRKTKTTGKILENIIADSRRRLDAHMKGFTPDKKGIEDANKYGKKLVNVKRNLQEIKEALYEDPNLEYEEDGVITRYPNGELENTQGEQLTQILPGRNMFGGTVEEQKLGETKLDLGRQSNKLDFGRQSNKLDFGKMNIPKKVENIITQNFERDDDYIVAKKYISKKYPDDDWLNSSQKMTEDLNASNNLYGGFRDEEELFKILRKKELRTPEFGELGPNGEIIPFVSAREREFSHTYDQQLCKMYNKLPEYYFDKRNTTQFYNPNMGGLVDIAMNNHSHNNQITADMKLIAQKRIAKDKLAGIGGVGKYDY